MHLDHDACYRAICAREARFDGVFVTAVTTTGIFCRPSCPARTPGSQNVAFLGSPAAALEAGFRSCKRCRPDAAPGSPDWDRRGDLVGRAVRMLGSTGGADAISVPALARRLAVSDRHLRRLFAEDIGASPVTVATAQRVATARLLAEQTDLPFAEIAFAAGFSSIRRFNDVVRTSTGCTPSQLRFGVRAEEAAPGRRTSGGLDISLMLPARAPYDGAGLGRFLHAHRMPGVDGVVNGTWRARTRGGVVEVTPTSAGVGVRLRLDGVARITPTLAAVRQVFDLDADPLGPAEAFVHDPVLGPLQAEFPGVRIPGAIDPFATAVRVVLGQQVSTAGATKLAERLVVSHGHRHDDDPVTGWSCPRPEDLVEAPLETTVGMPASRATAVRSLAAACLAGDVVIDRSADRDEQHKALLAVRGIGPWTASVIAAVCLGDPDAFADTDLILRRAIAAAGVTPAMWSPWRSYAMFLLWVPVVAARA